MTVLVDTSVLIAFLRRDEGALTLLGNLDEPALTSEICRVEVLAALGSAEDALAAELFALVEWIPVVEAITTRAGALGRHWRRSHSGIAAADLIIAATAELTDSSVLTLNVEHFPMLDGLKPAY
jgi:predicted nucleic acid-binding protein